MYYGMQNTESLPTIPLFVGTTGFFITGSGVHTGIYTHMFSPTSCTYRYPHVIKFYPPYTGTYGKTGSGTGMYVNLPAEDS